MSKKVMKLASRGKRLGAYLIDRVVPVIIGIILLTAVSVLAYVPRMFSSYGYNDFGYGNYGYAHTAGSVALLGITFFLYLVYVAVQLIFYAKSKTIGKAILGMQVVSSETGEPIGFWKMLLREWFAKKASKVVFYLGFIWVLIDDKNRAWHDKIMDTYVVDLKESAALKGDEKPTEYTPLEINDEDDAKAESIAKEMGNEAIIEVTDFTPAEEETSETAEATAEEAAEAVDVVIAENAAEAVAEEAENEDIEAEVVVLEEETAKADASMKKDELLALAKEMGVKVSSKATKAEIIEAINNK